MVCFFVAKTNGTILLIIIIIIIIMDDMIMIIIFLSFYFEFIIDVLQEEEGFFKEARTVRLIVLVCSYMTQKSLRWTYG